MRRPPQLDRTRALAGERDQSIATAIRTAKPREPPARHPHVRKSRNSRLRQGFGEARRSATREGGLFDEARQTLAVAQVRCLRAERLEVVAHQLVQGALLGSARLISE